MAPNEQNRSNDRITANTLVAPVEILKTSTIREGANSFSTKSKTIFAHGATDLALISGYQFVFVNLKYFIDWCAIKVKKMRTKQKVPQLLN